MARAVRAHPIATQAGGYGEPSEESAAAARRRRGGGRAAAGGAMPKKGRKDVAKLAIELESDQYESQEDRQEEEEYPNM